MTDRSTLIALAAMLTAMVLLPVGDALSKLLVEVYPAEQITWVRNLVHAGLILPLALRGGARIPLSPAHLWRAIVFVLMAVLYIAALRYLPLADGQALIFTFPLMVMAWSAFALGQAVGAVRWSAALAGLIGVVLVVQPGFRELTLGVPLALGAAVSAATYILLTRRLTGTAPQLMLLAMPAVFSVIVLAPAVPWRWVTPDMVDLAVMVVIGLLSMTIHLLLIMAYTQIEPSAIAPLAYLQIAVGVVLGWFVFGDLPNAIGAVGLVMVVLSGVVISVREHRRRKT